VAFVPSQSDVLTLRRTIHIIHHPSGGDDTRIQVPPPHPPRSSSPRSFNPIPSPCSKRTPLCTLFSTNENDNPDIPSSDPASTTAELLASLWTLISQAIRSTMVKGETRTVLYPNMKSIMSTPSYLAKLMGHLDACKDVCDFFGTKIILVPHRNNNLPSNSSSSSSSHQMMMVEGFTVKSFRNPHKQDEYEFDYDPFWDDGDDWDYEGVDAEVEGMLHHDHAAAASAHPMQIPTTPDNDREIISITQTWVGKMMSDMGICPFTNGPNQAGLPMGPVYYTVDRGCTQMEDMYARYWNEVVRVEQTPQAQLSTTLLIAPEFCIDNIELFESFSNTLTQPLTALGLEEWLQLVFFHPQWTFRDGGERSGTGAAANYARRSPWPMINLLRTKQVRAAQRGIPTGLVYQQNERTLSGIGAEKLEVMLRNRDWSDISDVQVNRRDMEALRVAQDYQQTGKLDEKDTSFEFDATPAANKVNRDAQMEGGNMVNVLKEALTKRLQGHALSGPETSATVMASDFLLEELERIVEMGGTAATATTSSSSTIGIPLTKEERMLEAKRMILQDLEGDGIESGYAGDELNAMFGSGGITTRKSDDEGTKGGGQFDMFY
jgi:hypothetical protein